MHVVESVLGNVHDGAFADRYPDDAEALVVDGTDRRRSRFRATTDAGTELGVVLGDATLAPGDVLLADDDRLVVVEFADRAALVVDLAGVDPSRDALRTAVELGHAAGNRHWDLAVDGDRLLFPVADDADRMADELAPWLPEGARVDTATVNPTLFDGSPSDHDHGDGGPGDGHGHRHSHADDHDHGDGGPGDGHSHGDEAAKDHGHGDTHEHDHGDAHEHDHGDDGPTEGGDRE